MAERPLHYRDAPPQTKRLAVVAVLLVFAAIGWLAYFGHAAPGKGGSVMDRPGYAVGFWILGAAVCLVVYVVSVEFARLRAAGELSSVLASPQTKPRAIGSGIAWIPVLPTVHQHYRFFIGSQYVAAVILAAVGVATLPSLNAFPGMQRFVIWVYSIAVASLVAGAVIGHRAMNRSRHSRLGTDGIQIFYDPGNGNIESAALDTVRVDHTNILIGSRILRLVDPWRRTAFPIEEVRSYILARLREECFVRQGMVGLIALSRGNIAMVTSALMVVVTLMMMLIAELRPDLQQAWMQSLVKWLMRP
jgi:hypothetical protein